MYTRTRRKNKEKEEVRLEEFICNLKNTERLRYFKIQAPKIKGNSHAFVSSNTPANKRGIERECDVYILIYNRQQAQERKSL